MADLIWSRQPVREALRGRRQVLSVWCTARARETLDWLPEGARVEPAARLSARAGSEEHHGVVAEVARLKKENPDAQGPIPAELVTASGSGLDPHLSPEAVRYQIPRVAAARGMPETELAALVGEMTRPPQLGIFGEPTVNVLLLNLALDRAHPVPGGVR